MKRSALSVFLRLLSMLGTLRYVMIFAILFGVFGFVASTFISVYAIRAVIELLNQQFDKGAFLVGIILAFGFLRGVFRYIEQMANHYIAFKLLATIRDIVFESLRRLAPAKLEKHNKGDLISIITSDIELLEVFYAHTISPVCIAVVMAVIMTYYISTYHVILGALALVIFIAIGYVLPVIIKKSGGTLADEYRAMQGKLGGFVLDSLRGLNEINQYNHGSTRLEQINALTDDIRDVELKFKQKGADAQSLTNYFIISLNLVYLCVVGFLYQSAEIGFETAITTFVALISAYGPFIAVANLGFTLQNTIAAANRVIDIIDEEPMIPDVKGKKKVKGERIECKDLNFSYADHNTADGMVLKDLNIAFHKDKIIGIMGKSGSGKSTLLRLLMRFWDRKSGEIFFDDVDISEIDTDNLRDIEAFVTQDTQLFNDTIKNNIKLANLHASDEEVVEACKKANLHDLISSLPQGYETKIGELGERLSGGEKQRISIARAFLRNPNILLLDESTSNLDSLNEAIILNSIYEQSKQKAVIIVSHRESTLKLADRIYEMREGSLNENRLLSHEV